MSFRKQPARNPFNDLRNRFKTISRNFKSQKTGLRAPIGNAARATELSRRIKAGAPFFAGQSLTDILPEGKAKETINKIKQAVNAVRPGKIIPKPGIDDISISRARRNLSVEGRSQPKSRRIDIEIG